MDKSNPNAFLQLIGFWKKTIYYVVFKRILIDLAAYLNTMIEQKKVESGYLAYSLIGLLFVVVVFEFYSITFKAANIFSKNVGTNRLMLCFPL